jgi:hypothetical protein
VPSIIHEDRIVWQARVKPSWRGCLSCLAIQVISRLADQPLQRPQIQLGPGATVIARVPAGRGPAGLRHERGDVGNGRGAGGALAVPQHLGQEGPQHDGGGEYVVLGKQGVAVGEGPLDHLGREHLAKGQSFTLEEWLHSSTEGVLARGVACG